MGEKESPIDSITKPFVEPAAFFIEEKGQEDIAMTLAHGGRFVKQRAGEDHGVAGGRCVEVGAILRKQQPAAVVFFGVQIQREGKAPVRVMLHHIVSVCSEVPALLSVITNHFVLFDTGDLARERFFGFRVRPSGPGACEYHPGALDRSPSGRVLPCGNDR